MSRFRPEIEALKAYAMADEACAIKVNQNEAPWDWPAELKAEAARLVDAVAFNRYPPFDERALTAALAERWRLPPQSVLVGNGSNELLMALFLSALGPGRKVLLPSPTFSLYRQLALLAGAQVAEVLLKDGGVAYKAESWLKAVRREHPEFVLLCSPNNPTGSLFPPEALGDLLKETPGLVAVDEAYGEFAGVSAREHLPKAENLVVLRTFSKAWGGAGLRLGYLLAAPQTAAQVRKALLPYNVSPVTAGLGVLALRNAALFESRLKAMVEERERLQEKLGRLPGLTVYPSRANFVLVRVAKGAASERYKALKRRGVLVRDVSHLPGLERCLRISVGSAGENEAVLRLLEEVLA
jgi:histidinol-phosphate aminotransferase